MTQGKLLYGWDAVNGEWVKLRVDASGYVKVDLSLINLNDLADLDAAAPDDEDVLTWNDALEKWVPAAGGGNGGFTSRARAYADAVDQTIPTGSWTRVLLDAENYDGLGEFNNRVVIGTADATQANKLHDADGGFEAGDVGAWIWNTTDDTYTQVTAFVDTGELTLAGDIMASGEGYRLYHSIFVASETGYYAVCASIRYPNPETSDKYVFTAIYKNGATHASAGGNISNASLIIAVPLADIIYLEATDYLELRTLHNQTAKDDISSSSTTTFLAIHRLS